MGRLTAGVLALALVVTACGDDDGGEDGSGEDATSAAVTFEALVGKTFVSTEVTGRELVDGTTVELTFIDGRVSALAGCNTQIANADVVDGKLVVERLAGTLMGCEQPLVDQDQWLADLLGAEPEVALDGEVLTLTAGDEGLELAEQS